MKLTKHIFIAAFLGLTTLSVWAEPQFALRTGLKCAQCHVNKSGGGKRTPFGASFAQSQLSSGHLVPEDAEFFSGDINENVSVGANFRVDEKFLFAYEGANPSDTSTFGNGTTVAPTTGRVTNVTEGNIYMHYKLIPDYFSLYLDQTVHPVTSSREFFALLEGLPLNSYVKYGYVLLPYGLRLIDDADKAVVRSATGYSYGRSALATEIGIEEGPTSFIANITSSNFSLVGQYIHNAFRVGASLGHGLKGNGFTLDNSSSELGIFGGVGFTNIALGSFYDVPSVTFMFEVDRITRKEGGIVINSRAYFSQLDLEFYRGIIFKTIYEVLHPDELISIKRNGNTRTTLGLEYYPNPYMALSFLYRAKKGIPQNVLWNQNDVIARFHFFM
jgi:hypothetical protein